MSATDSNRGVYDRGVDTYKTLELQRPEQALLKLFKDRWAGMTMLDVGVGTGRTSYTFAPIVKRYVGIDYSSLMIESSRSLLREDETTSFLVCDARDMAGTLDERFDFVLFSFNGLDSVGHEDRLAILSEIRRVTKDDGYFCFSSHSLLTLPFTAERPSFDLRRPIRSAYQQLKAARRAVRLGRQARQIDEEALRREGWGLLRDGAHQFELVVYYVDPSYQARQLEDHGFRVVDVYNLDGDAVSIDRPGRDPWLYYLCRPL